MTHDLDGARADPLQRALARLGREGRALLGDAQTAKIRLNRPILHWKSTSLSFFLDMCAPISMHLALEWMELFLDFRLSEIFLHSDSPRIKSDTPQRILAVHYFLVMCVT